MSTRQPVLLVAVLLAAFLALGAAYVLIVPLWESPDEPSTVSTALTVATMRRVPTPHTQPLFPGVTLNAKLHPPAYFALMGLVFSPVRHLQPEIEANPFGGVSAEVARYQHAGGIPADRFRGASFLRGVRGISVLLGALTLIVVWRTARLLMPGSILGPFLGVAVFGLTPTFIFSHAAIDPLPLAVLAATLAAHRMVRLYLADSVTPQGMRMLGILLIAGFAVRSTLVFLYLPAAFLVWREKGHRLQMAGQIAAPAVLGMAWMLVLSPGPSLLALRHLGGQLVKVDRPFLSRAGLTTLALHSKNSFWARFGWADLYAPARLIDVFDLISLLIAAGLILVLVKRKVPPGSFFVAAAAGIGVLGYVKGNLAQFDPQGRYLGLLIGLYAPLGGIGLAMLLSPVRRQRIRIVIGATVLVVMIGTNVYALAAVIRPTYAARLYPGLGVDAYQDQGTMVYGGPSTGQSFIARKSGLTRIELYFTPARHSPRRVLEFQLLESPLIPEPLAIARVPYPAPGDRPHTGFTFAPQWDSENRSYYVRVAVVPEGAPVSTWFTLEDRYVGGSRYADDTPVPGDLRFTAYYELP
ncbi:hypothetical protein JXA88_18100 [Candidatus Fermentibacteria bacterium]|nr:hypothetical protein [Candidatus Fermentibacteria bacterium]